MSTDIVTAEYREASAPLTSRQQVEAAIDSSQNFEYLKTKLLSPSKHFFNIQGRDRVNAAGWDTLASALRISVTILSNTSAGHPGAYRELLEDAKGKRIVSYAITVRASFMGRNVDMTGRCDSTETKHAQSEHKMESVAYTRAKNRAVCQIVGGANSDIAEEMDDHVSEARSKAQTVTQVPTATLTKLWNEKGCPDESLGMWMVANIPRYKYKTVPTPEQSLMAHALLMELP